MKIFTIKTIISIYNHLSECYLKTIYRENELILSIYEYKCAYTFIFHLWNFRVQLCFSLE